MGKKILIIRLSSLGDIILTSAAVINLKIACPDSRITFLCKEDYRPVVELISGVDQIVTVPRNCSAATYFKLLLELDGENFGTLVDLQGNIRSWFARKIITANTTVKYPKRRFHRLLAVTGKVIPRLWPHTIDLYNEAVVRAGADACCRRPVLKIPRPETDERFDKFVTNHPQYIVISPGAAHTNKQWPLEKFEQVSADLKSAEAVSSIWVLTGNDGDAITRLEQRVDADDLVLVDYPIPRLARIIAGAQLTVSNDSGIAHLASAVGTPVVAVFGPTHPALGFSPRGLLDEVVEVDEYCRPCSLHGKKPCYRDRRYCFDRISPEMVGESAAKTLAAQKETAPAVFVDRDGTIIVDKNFLSSPDEIEFEEGAVKALRLLRDQGFRIVIISNQSGVARGFFSTEAADRVNACLLELLAAEHVDIDAVYYCPHHPEGSVNEYAIKCDCRKPGPAMAEEAAYQVGADFRKSYVVGDKIDDVNLAGVIGATPVLVGTGYGRGTRSQIENTEFYSNVWFADNILAAARRITEAGKDD
ncbi:MAG: HAD-IIIA family hydrolase [Candidatus Zixiibacteriota bacterium]|nr:MAG: HAD-IIIA family hydrolase [candidate division Zixibacteria bacterium]